MLKRLQIRNFRGFNRLEVDPLSGVNLIAGRNNSGKTSLLEAIFLLAWAGNAQVAMNTNVLRDMDFTGAVTPPLWKQLFTDLDMGTPIAIGGYHTSYGELALEIGFERRPTTEIPLDGADRMSATNLFDERALTFKYNGPSGKPVEGHIRMKGQGIELEQPPTTTPTFTAIILLSRIRNVHDDAVRLGTLRRKKQGDLVLRALQVVEPRLQSIEDNSSSGMPLIWGDVGLPELVPLSVMGEGMSQIARLVIAIASTPNGIVLVDEVENGIHHSVLPEVWRVIDEAARQFGTQIFATTHSLECVTAAHGSLGNDRFRLHRLEVGKKKSHCITYEPDSIDAAIQHGLEVR